MSINNIRKKIFLSQRDESDKENQKKIERERERAIKILYAIHCYSFRTLLPKQRRETPHPTHNYISVSDPFFHTSLSLCFNRKGKRTNSNPYV